MHNYNRTTRVVYSMVSEVNIYTYKLNFDLNTKLNFKLRFIIGIPTIDDHLFLSLYNQTQDDTYRFYSIYYANPDANVNENQIALGPNGKR